MVPTILIIFHQGIIILLPPPPQPQGEGRIQLREENLRRKKEKRRGKKWRKSSSSRLWRRKLPTTQIFFRGRQFIHIFMGGGGEDLTFSKFFCFFFHGFPRLSLSEQMFPEMLSTSEQVSIAKIISNMIFL